MSSKRVTGALLANDSGVGHTDTIANDRNIAKKSNSIDSLAVKDVQLKFPINLAESVRAADGYGGVVNLAFQQDGSSGDIADKSFTNSVKVTNESEINCEEGAEVFGSNSNLAKNGTAGTCCDVVDNGQTVIKPAGDPATESEEFCSTKPESSVSRPADEQSDSLHKVKKVEASLKQWVTGPNFLVYVSHFLSAWGDRMWSFGAGVFLVSIASENLQLPAIYGLSSGLTIFFLGALVGDWVDSTARLRAAQISLILQNVLVVVCAAGVYAYLYFWSYIEGGDARHWLVPLSHAGIISVAILANLASLARTIAIERDWIVEICGKDKDMLANMTASLRRIDQATLILAPIATGQIMTFAGLRNGAVFIAAWNAVSVFAEYYMIWKVYNTVPALMAKKELRRIEISAVPAGAEEEGKLDVEGGEMAELGKEGQMADPDGISPLAENNEGNGANASGDIMESKEEVKEDQNLQAEVAKADKKTQRKCSCTGERVFSRFITLYRGWRMYMGYSVALAGLALACLYMTVLGFDNITVAYALTQGVSEAILGILMGVSAVFGILGTFAYPLLRRRLGLVRTGILALSAQVSCLTLCVVSVWMPGSPFDPFYLNRAEDKLSCGNSSLSQVVDQASVSTAVSATLQVPYTVTTLSPHLVMASSAGDNSTNDCGPTAHDGPQPILSVGMLMAGIVLARFGLWIADLTITQLFLEDVRETERGIVNGVQSSLNKLMDVLKFVLVVAVPDTETFGFLIIISFAFICFGWLMYAIFLRKARGHFFHFEKCVHGASNGGAELQAA